MKTLDSCLTYDLLLHWDLTPSNICVHLLLIIRTLMLLPLVDDKKLLINFEALHLGNSARYQDCR